MKNKSMLWNFGLLLLMVFMLAGCNFGGSSEKTAGEDKKKTDNAKSEKVANLSLSNDIPDLNQLKTTDGNSFNVLNNVMEGLFRQNENNEPEPAMAESYEVSDDGLTYTFTLRDGIKWSNGDPVTASDFKYSWLKIMHPDTASSYGDILYDYIEGAEAYANGEASEEEVAITVKDDKTLEVKLKAPTPYFLGLTAFAAYFPLNEKFVEGQGDQFGLSHEAILYNGPYVLTSFDQASGVTMEKNTEYWDKENVAIDKVNLKVLKDTSTALNLYLAGDLDKVYLSSEDVNTYKDNPEFNTEIEFRTYFLQFNTTKEPFNNVNIRKALQLAYDPKILSESILNNGSEPSFGLIPTEMTGDGSKSFRELQGEIIQPDAEKAKEHWEKGVSELGKEPVIELLTSDDTISKDTGTFLQSEFKKNLGIDITLVTKPFSGRLDTMRADDYTVGVNRWGADFNDPINYLDLWNQNVTPLRGNYQNPKYDELLSAAKSEVDTEKRMEYLLEAEKLLIQEDAVVAPLYYDGHSYLQKEYLKGLVMHPFGLALELKGASIDN